MKKRDSRFKLAQSTALLSLVLFLSSCDDFSGFTETAPTFLDPTVSEVTFTTANIEGGVEPTNNASILSSGFCWSLAPNPTTEHHKTVEDGLAFVEDISELIANTTYYVRPYAITQDDTFYGEEFTITTMSLENTSWKLATLYTNDFVLYSQVNLYYDGTTKFDEMDYPNHCPGCFITYGTWKLEGNEFTYIWEGAEEDLTQSTYVYKGTLSEKSIQGTYEHISASDGDWSAELL